MVQSVREEVRTTDAAPGRLLPLAALEGRLVSHDSHVVQFGVLPAQESEALIQLVEASGLTGRGGAGFPTARKLRATAGKRPVVVGNGSEGEPASSKDRALLALVPHLVLDGLNLAARAVGARESILTVADPKSVEGLALTAAARHRAGVDPLPVTVVKSAGHFLDGEESALSARLSGKAALPRTRPPAVYEKGVSGRPTLVQNVETLAHLALIARYGAAWFRGIGTDAEPGSMLASLSGAVRSPGVVEVGLGTPLSEVIARAGGATSPIGAVLVGGFHGAWVAGSDVDRIPLSRSGLQPFLAQPGAGVISVLPATACGVIESAAILRYLADQSAGQCGPCLNGLPAIAAVMDRVAGGAQDRSLPTRLLELASLVERRGACHHPDGTARFLRSTLATFGPEIELHLAGRCSTPSREPVLPVPARTSRG
jgi:NADH:ubiquinone oxidoreductase subunit F (NADH-binding)